MITPSSHEQRVRVELERLRSINPQWLKARYTVGRFFVRLLRIAFGVAMVGVAVYMYQIASAKTDIPFALMTIKDLATLLFGFCGALIFLIWAFHSAFGEAPDPQQAIEASLHNQAEEAVAAMEQCEADRAAATREAAEEADWWYRRGRALGLLFDSTLSQWHIWVPLVSVAVALAILAGIILLAT